MFIINFLIGIFTKKLGASEKAAGPLAWVTAIVTAALFLWGAYEGWKALVIADHETEQRADEAEKTIEQMEEAEGVDEQLEDRDDGVIDDLEEGARNAAQDDPEGAADTSGPATTSVHDGLRNSRKPR